MNMVSVVVPVYNTERYVSECINSVLRQTYQEWELILVDDGSNDDSGSICDSYSNNNSIKVFHTVNNGVTAARKYGAEKASGEWITFLDSDDTLPETALKDLITASNEETDIIIGSITHVNSEQLISKEEYREYTIKGWYFHTGPVAKLFRRTLFDDFSFDIPREIVFGEDMIMNIRIAFNNQKNVTVIKNNVYSYRQNEDNQTNSFISSEEYESLFTKHWLASIPQSEIERYAQPVFRKLYDNFVIRLVNNESMQSEWRSSDSYKEILEIVDRYNIRLTIGERVALFMRPLWMSNYYLRKKYKRKRS